MSLPVWGVPGLGDVSDWQRYLVVRDPYSRWLSVYRHLSRPGWNQWAAREIQGRNWTGRWGPDKPSGKAVLNRPPMNFGQFMNFIADQRIESQPRRPSLADGSAYRSPWVWLDRLDESLRYLSAGALEPVKLIHTEKLWPDMAALLPGVDLKEYHSNRSIDKIPGARTPVELQYERVGLCSPREKAPDGCLCGACRVGVAVESASLRRYARSIGRRAFR